MIKAYSYKRFSTPEQAKGDSLRRQTALAEAYCKAHGLELDTELNLNDLGISAFRGANAATGKLSDFLQAIAQGHVSTGSYLIVENLDRLTRDHLVEATTLFLQIINSGIVIVSLGDNRIYDRKMDFGSLLVALTSLARANEESARKSELKLHSWANKHNRALDRTVTKWVPAWLVVDKDRKIQVVPERVAIVQRIFAMAGDGYGIRLILQWLNENNVQPFGTSPTINASESHQPKRWYQSRVFRILKSRSVIGEYTPKGREPIKGYYPSIVSEEDFYSAILALEKRAVARVAGRKGQNVTNLFSGLLRCGYSSGFGGFKCAGNDESMGVINKGKKSPSRYLMCSRIREGGFDCSACSKYWQYPDFEGLFLNHITNIDFSVIFGRDADDQKAVYDLERLVVTEQGRLTELETQIQNLVDFIASSKSPSQSVHNRITALENDKVLSNRELELLESQLLSARYNLTHRSENISEAAALFQKGLVDGLSFDQRIKLSQIIRSHIETIYVYSAGFIGIPSDHLRSEFRDYIKRAAEQVETPLPPAFMVKYKSGNFRVVISGEHPSGSERIVTVFPEISPSINSEN